MIIDDAGAPRLVQCRFAARNRDLTCARSCSLQTVMNLVQCGPGTSGDGFASTCRQRHYTTVAVLHAVTVCTQTGTSFPHRRRVGVPVLSYRRVSPIQRADRLPHE